MAYDFVRHMNCKTTDRSLRFGMDRLYQLHCMRLGTTLGGGDTSWSGFGCEYRVYYDIELDENAHFIRLYSRFTDDYEQTIRLVATTPHYGGIRWWFVCPVTGKRCATLYSSPLRLDFASREAHGIRYSSQLERPSSRLMRRYRNTKQRFEVPDGFVCCPKLKGMHQSTCDKRNRIFEELNRRALLDLYRSLRR